MTDDSDLKTQNHTLTTIVPCNSCFSILIVFSLPHNCISDIFIGQCRNKTKILKEAISRAPLAFHFLCAHPAVFIHEPLKHDVYLDETPGYVIHILLDLIFC